MISGFQTLRQARPRIAGLEPATEGSPQILGQVRCPLCHQRSKKKRTERWACPQHSDLKLSGPPSSQGANGGARTCNRSFLGDLMADSVVTMQRTSPFLYGLI
ncbi:hypothetical protein PoB_007537900 [Plakobranchus ocellatus]|uniref:Uncharacterized protein n=1 Tax=Plakobranchus ocellatus TaxID=259542 RepID=A0AAV4DXR8_9GAST|nr:hypothetical protein PoB_007537900 [Plakobranchus ocellatus]